MAKNGHPPDQVFLYSLFKRLNKHWKQSLLERIWAVSPSIMVHAGRDVIHSFFYTSDSWSQLHVRPVHPGFSVGRGTVSYALVKQITENPIRNGLSKISPHKIKYSEVRGYLHWSSRSKISSGHSVLSLFSVCCLSMLLSSLDSSPMVTNCSSRHASVFPVTKREKRQASYDVPFYQENKRLPHTRLCLDFID